MQRPESVFLLHSFLKQRLLLWLPAQRIPEEEPLIFRRRTGDARLPAPDGLSRIRKIGGKI